MLSLKKLGECDLSTIDLRTITAKEWEALKREVHRRAQAERAKVMRDPTKRLRRWWQSRKQRRDRVLQTYASSQKHAV